MQFTNIIAAMVLTSVVIALDGGSCKPCPQPGDKHCATDNTKILECAQTKNGLCWTNSEICKGDDKCKLLIYYCVHVSALLIQHNRRRCIYRTHVPRHRGLSQYLTDWGGKQRRF
jgi:hypothetical protein